MAKPLRAATLFQNTCLNLDPVAPACFVDIPIPSNASFPSRNSPKRRRIERRNETFDERSFSRLSLASEADIYFRPHKSASRKRKSEPAQLKSILWRILDNRLCLELQSVELSQDAKQKDALLTLRLIFENKIRIGGVAIAEARAQAGEAGYETPLTLFVVTVAGELFTITLTRAIFVKKSETAERDVQEWCQSHRPSAFSYRTPFRMQATDDTELWFALGDGSLLKLERSVSDVASDWRETFFTEGVWKTSLKGLMPWTGQRTMHYEGVDLDLKSATSIACSPDGKHIWAVCLDHTLKAWSIATGKIIVNRDLSNDWKRDLQKPPEYVIDPVQSNLLRVYPDGTNGEYLIVTFSPKTREFKFWSIRDASDAENGVIEKRPEAHLIPPIEDLTDTTVWTLENFFLQTNAPDWMLWVSVRSGTHTHVYSVTFDITNITQDLQRQWVDNWAIVNPGLNTADALKVNIQNPCDLDPQLELADSENITERWLRFIFYPGRFTISTLETALSVYQNGIGQRSRQSRSFHFTRNQHLAQRICHIVGSSVSLALSSNDRMAYERFTKDVATQWQMFYGVVLDLHQRREVSLAFAFDNFEGTPWQIMADCIAPSRRCGELELLWHNRDTFANPQDIKPGSLLLQNLSESIEPELDQVFYVVDTFRHSFSKSFLTSFQVTVRSMILDGFGSSADDPIRGLYEQAGFEGQVSDDDYEHLTDAMETIGGFAAMNDSVFEAILDLLNEKLRGHHQKQELTKHGAMTVVRGAQETLHLGNEILLSLLLLVVFMDSELEASDVADMVKDFHAKEVFTSICGKMKEYSLLSWLADNTRQVLAEPYPGSSNMESSQPDLAETGKVSITVLESIFIGDWANMPFPNGSQSTLLTYWCRAWVFGPNLSQHYDGVTTYIMGNLLKNEDLDLASDFVQYLPNIPWARYLRGRLYLARSENTEAATHFKQAAKGLATGKFFDLDQYDRAGLLAPSEHDYFNDGLPRYFKHIIMLYTALKVPSYAADFAQLALSAFPALPSPGSSTHDEAAALRSELLMRLFTAALQTSQYTLAHAALAQYPDADLIQPALHSLTTALLATGRVDVLLSLPFAPDLAAQVDDVLATIVAKAAHTYSSTAPAALRRTTGAALPVSEYWKVLHAWRVRHNDFRGAALVLWERLQVLKRGTSTAAAGLLAGPGTWAQLSETYVMLVTALSLVEPQWAWILVRPGGMASTTAVNGAAETDGAVFGSLRKISSPMMDANGEVAAAQPGVAKRRIVTLADVRREWQEELDRRADIEAGRFAFGIGGDLDGARDGMEVDGEDDVFV